MIALVELDEGPRMLTNIVGVPPEPEHLPLDGRVQVEFAAARRPGAAGVPHDRARAADGRRGAAMTGMHGGNVAIVGASETREVGVLPDRSMIQLHAEAALAALAGRRADRRRRRRGGDRGAAAA